MAQTPAPQAPGEPGAPRRGRVSHQTRVAAAAEDVHRLLADLSAWPGIFPTFVHLEPLGTAEGQEPPGAVDGPGAEDGWERIGMWGLSGDRVDHWVALRRVDDAARRVEFRPSEPHPPLASMSRVWTSEPVSARECLVRLEHAYALRSDAADEADEAVRGTIDTIAEAELSAVRTAAELRASRPDLLLTVEDAVDVAAPPGEVYRALDDAAHWPEFMAHVLRTEVTDSGAGAHLLEMETRESHGGTFTTRTARVGRPDHTLAYRQLLLPPIGRSHTVTWRLTPRADGGTTVRSEQFVVIDEAGVGAVLGEGSDIRTAHDFIRTELSGKVRLILDAVKNRSAAVTRRPTSTAATPGA